MPKPGETFDRYTIESVLGEGGMGVVYKAFDPRLDRRVALKVVRGGGERAGEGETHSPQATARLLREARAAAALDHPNAVAIFDLGEVDGEAFIAMELVSGHPLRSFIGQLEVPVAVRLRWLYDVARVLATAHRAGLVHRDMKPENVMIRDDGDVKVLDFGIARSLRGDSPAASLAAALPPPPTSNRSLTVGTPLYMAPEQIRGSGIDGRTDQFAWGVVAYELLAGRVPWAVGATDRETMARIVNDEPLPLRAVAPAVPTVVADVVARTLRKDPAERFPAMDSIVTLIEPVLGLPSSKASAAVPRTTEPMSLRVTTGDASYAPHRSSDAPARAAWRRWAAPVALSGAAVTLVTALATRTQAPPLPAPQATVTAPTLPANPAAASKYGMAIQARRSGMTSAAGDLLKEVVALDPSFAPAVLRLALVDYGANQSVKEARDLLQRATVMRGSLTEPDQALLDAMAPCVLHYEMAHGECEDRLRAASTRYPDDLDILRELASQETFADKLDLAIATCREALAKEPTYVYFRALIGELQAYGGHLDEAVRTLEECTQERPEATTCIDYRIAIHVAQNDCAAVESDARDWISAAPRDGGRWGPQHYLADAQIALGRPSEAVIETLTQEWAKAAATERAGTEALDRTGLAVLSGDFRAAEVEIAALEKDASGDDGEQVHAIPAALRVELFGEEGRVAEMGEVADAFLRRRESWTRDTREDDWEIAQDVTMRMNDALLRAGKITRPQFAAARTAWLGRWERSRVARYAWFPAYAYWTETNDDAREALAAIPTAGLPPYRPFVYGEAALGRAHLLAGDADGAEPLLRHGASGCYALEDPFTTVRSHLWLGAALEKKGDTAGACDAYAFVVAHWGNAKPRSISAGQAKTARARLRCGP